MKVNFTDAITITQLFQNDDIKENHFKSLNSTERRVCMASFRILKERTIDNPPKKEHKHLNQKIIQNITDKLNGPEPVKGKKRLHKINSLFKGIANRFFGRISSSKIQKTMTAYNTDLNNAKDEIKDLKMNIRNEEAELKTSNEKYEQLMDDYFKEIRFERNAHIMATVFKSTHLSKKFSQKIFDELPDEHRVRLTRDNLKANFTFRGCPTVIHIPLRNSQKTLIKSHLFLSTMKLVCLNSTNSDTENKITGLERNISRLNKQVEIRNKKYAFGTSDSSSESEC